MAMIPREKKRGALGQQRRKGTGDVSFGAREGVRPTEAGGCQGRGECPSRIVTEGKRKRPIPVADGKSLIRGVSASNFKKKNCNHLGEQGKDCHRIHRS